MNDIFKDMQAKIGCEYLSDLPSYKRKVWHEMKLLNSADYDEKQLEDFSKYVFGMSYQHPCFLHCSSRPFCCFITSFKVWYDIPNTYFEKSSNCFSS